MAGGSFYFVCVHWYVSNIRLINSLLLIILLLTPPWALRQPRCSRLLRVIQLTVIVLTLANFIPCQLAALQACVYLPPFRWLPARLG